MTRLHGDTEQRGSGEAVGSPGGPGTACTPCPCPQDSQLTPGHSAPSISPGAGHAAGSVQCMGWACIAFLAVRWLVWGNHLSLYDFTVNTQSTNCILLRRAEKGKDSSSSLSLYASHHRLSSSLGLPSAQERKVPAGSTHSRAAGAQCAGTP